MQCSFHYQLQIRLLRGNISVMSGAVKTRSTQTGNENLPKKTMLKDYRQKQLAVKARIKYREHTLQGFKQHLKNGTFPRRMKSIKPYPKMETPEAQAIVNEACDQAQSVILDQIIQEEEKKLSQDQDSCQTMRKQREGARQQRKTHQNPKKPTVAQLQRELRDLPTKYTLLCQKLDSGPQE